MRQIDEDDDGASGRFRINEGRTIHSSSFVVLFLSTLEKTFMMVGFDRNETR